MDSLHIGMQAWALISNIQELISTVPLSVHVLELIPAHTLINNLRYL